MQPLAVLSDEDLRRVPPFGAEYRDRAYFRSRRFVIVPLVAGHRVIGVASADNKALARLFYRMSKILDLKGENQFKAIAFFKVKDVLETMPQDVRGVWQDATPWGTVNIRYRKNNVKFDGNIGYKVTHRVTLFVQARNILNENSELFEDGMLWRVENFGSQWFFGVRGEF